MPEPHRFVLSPDFPFTHRFVPSSLSLKAVVVQRVMMPGMVHVIVIHVLLDAMVLVMSPLSLNSTVWMAVGGSPLSTRML
jgi:hypothetical protein